MSKNKPSKLDQYAETLLAMDDARKTLADMQAWLKEEGCTVSLGALSNFLSSQRESRLQEMLLQQIATGARQCKEVEAQLSKNPAPETETLIKLVRVLIMKFSTATNVTPEMSELVFNMLKPVIKWHEVQLKEGALALEQQKFQRVTCELFLKWFEDKLARDIASGSSSNSEKINKLGELMFGEDWR